ncbi:centromere/kinetochore protein zw10 homolog [Plutella xylostella]|uniref:centromere/kinetochore protein zw10 homolog n=1 Tax=Plutella xylostella TaxID=51655 RepID=UPI0020327702|nr:centromere/kinetochore protein zw10 homolog [Plutella xylostella]
MTDTQSLPSPRIGLEESNNMELYDVDEVLKTIFDSSESNNWKPEDKRPLIKNEIEKLKTELRQFLDESDYDVVAIVDESKNLCLESNDILQEMEACKKEIEEETMAEILKSIESHDTIAKELDRVNFTLNIICDIVACGKYMKEYEENKRVGSFTEAVETTTKLMQQLENPAEGFPSLAIYETYKQMALSTWECLTSDLMEQFYKFFSWSSKAEDKKTEINIDLKIDDSPDCLDVLEALIYCKELPVKVSEFASFLLTEVLVNFIHTECCVYPDTDELITITVYKGRSKPVYDIVIANIRVLFHHLGNKLNLDLGQEQTIMQMIGSEICLEFSDILVRECLIDTIPNSINEMQTYGIITTEIEELQRFLTKVKFFPDEGFSILYYLNNIDVLFAEKASQHYLETARAIMLKDLSSTMSIGVETIPDDNESEKPGKINDAGIEAALQILDSTIPKSLFYFPRCMISKTAQELLDLIYMMMEQAVQCSDVVGKRIYISARLIFELYESVVPYYHENFLQTIPQYVALFHNNCMYLAHNLQTFGDKWLVLMEGREPDYPITFVDLVPKLRELGQRQLAAHLQQQRKQILDNIRASDLNCIVVKDVLGENAEQAIRQCLRQLQLLKNVWIGVFPANLFTSLMATLVNMLADELAHRACSAEDVSAEMAAQLGDIYTVVVKKAPNLFQKPEDIEEHVATWTKLQELILILGGSLKDIEKRWDDGNGPLAVHFRTVELRNLIKALFQNTQIRANLLSKIK